MWEGLLLCCLHHPTTCCGAVGPPPSPPLPLVCPSQVRGELAAFLERRAALDRACHDVLTAQASIGRMVGVGSTVQRYSWPEQLLPSAPSSADCCLPTALPESLQPTSIAESALTAATLVAGSIDCAGARPRPAADRRSRGPTHSVSSSAHQVEAPFATLRAAQCAPLRA